MGWWGKVVGGALGFAFGGPLGAAFGAAVGHQFDRGLDGAEDGAGEQERIQTAFFTATFTVMGYVAKADGHVSPAEIAHAQAVMRDMRLSPEQVRVAKNLYREGKTVGFDCDAAVHQFVRESRRRRTLLQMFLEIQIQAACADGELHPREDAVLRRLAGLLGFSTAHYVQLVTLVRAAGGSAHGGHGAGRPGGGQRAAPARLDTATARAILGVTANASVDDIKKAYRRLMSQHHPDKLIAKGMPEEMVKVATTKAQEIRAAYELLSGRS
ncbi:MAG: co-chaperone DjlA [Gammaproteobacteria bacterium]